MARLQGPHRDHAGGGAARHRVLGSRGATWFKFQNYVTREMLAAGIDEAHARGLRVTGHLCSVTFTEAAALGLDALQHGFITNSDYVPNKQPDVCPPENMSIQADVDVHDAAVQQSIREIVAGGSAVVSTLGVYETVVPAGPGLTPADSSYSIPRCAGRLRRTTPPCRKVPSPSPRDSSKR